MMKNKTRSHAKIGISFKLLLNYSAVFCLAIFIGSAFIYIKIKSTILTNIEDELANSSKLIKTIVTTNTNNTINSYLRAAAMKNKDIISGIAQKYKNEGKSSEDAMELSREILLSQRIGKSGYIYCLNSKGILVVHPKEKLRNSDISKYDFVKKQIKSKNGYLEYNWKNPGEASERPKALYMSYFKPWDWIISVSSYREEFIELLDIEELKKNINTIKFGKTGYPYIVDSKGNMISHPVIKNKNVMDYQGANGKYFVREMCLKKKGKIFYSWKNPNEKTFKDKLVVYDYIPGFDWIVASSSYAKDFYEPLKTIKYTIAGTILFVLCLCIPLSLLFSRKIINPLNLVADTAHKLASYDLTVHVATTRKDEIGVLFQAIGEMVSQLKLLILEVKNNGDNLLNASLWMEDNMHNIAISAEQMNANAFNVSTMTKDMANYLNMIAKAAENMSISIDKCGKNARNGSQITEKAVELASNSVEKMNTLEKSASVIGEVTEVIKRIADKTSLLALNADIEAASAGEAGKGFAVVANEIKEFAKQSATAADRIAKRISTMQKNSTQAIKVIYDIADIINSINTSSERMTQELDEQIKTANEISSNVTFANNNINDIASSMAQLSQAVSNMSINLGIAATNLDDSVQIPSASDKSEYKNMTTSASEITLLTKNLINLVKKFKINK